MDTATILRAVMVLYLPLALCAPHHDVSVSMPMWDSPSPSTECQEDAECRCRMLETLVSRELSPSHCELLAAALATLVSWADQLQDSWVEQLAEMDPDHLLSFIYPDLATRYPNTPETPKTTPGYKTIPDNVTTSRSTTNVETTSEGATDNDTKDNKKVATTEKQDEGSSGKGKSGIILSPEYNKYEVYDNLLDTSTLIQVKHCHPYLVLTFGLGRRWCQD